MSNELIVIRQLPVIEEQLRSVKQAIQERVNEVLSMDCTEETYKEVKKARAELNKQYKDLEARRREVKAKIEAPYKAFESVYKACAGDIFTAADKKLAEKVRSVEDGLRQEKGKAVASYFNEYRESLGLPEDLAGIRFAGINITLSASEKSLKVQAKEFLDRLNDDLSLIYTYENRDEILTEYRTCRNVARAVGTVNERHKQIEQERIRRQAAQEALRQIEERAEEVTAVIEQEEPLSMPEAVEAPADEFHEPVAEHVHEENAPDTPTVEPGQPVTKNTYSVSFRVFGTLEQLKAMKKFLNDGGYEYEQL